MSQAILMTPSQLVDGTSCSDVRLTCKTIRLPLLRWYIDDLPLEGFFAYINIDQEFPHTIYDNAGVAIVVVNATREPSPSDNFNSTSVLTATPLALAKFNAREIRCGNDTIRSGAINLTHLNIQGSKLLHEITVSDKVYFFFLAPTFDCFLTPSARALDVSIQWSLSRLTAERYRVSVSPDPSSCSSGHVSPSQIYNCIGLMPQEIYNLNVSAVFSCGDVEQDSNLDSIIIKTQGM